MSTKIIADTVYRDVDEAVRALEGCTELNLDLETSGLSPLTSKIAVVSLYSPDKDVTAVLHVRGSSPPRLVDFLSRPGRVINTHNGTGFDIQFLGRAGVDVYRGPEWYDTMTGELATLVTDRRDVSVSLKATAKRRTGARLTKDIDHGGWMNPTLSEEQMDYVLGDIKYLHRIKQAQLEKVKGSSQERALRTEMRLIPAVVAMSLGGLPISRPNLDAYMDKLHCDRRILQERLFREFGGPINLRSAPQLRVALTTAGVPVVSTAYEYLRSVELFGGKGGELAGLVLRWRHADQRIKMYTEEWWNKFVVEHADGYFRCHARFWPCGTDTGRFCLSAKTLVEMPRDMAKYPHGIPITEVKPGDWVYSFTTDKKLCLRRVKWVGKTGTKSTLKVTARCQYTGDTVVFKATPEHLVRMYNGDWRPTGALRPGNRLMCMPRRKWHGPYAWLAGGMKRSRTDGVGGRVMEHRWVYAQTHGLDRIPAHYDVHHENENQADNTPSNLVLKTHSSHVKMHRPKTPREVVRTILAGDRENHLHPKVLRRLAKEYDLLPTNHTVVSVEPGEYEDVWDLEVEDTHTLIADGVVVHNSSSEPNLQQVPRDMRWVFEAQPGYVILAADYAQIEVRCAAEIARDAALIEAFERGEGDAHRSIASDIFQKPPDQISAEERRTSKAATFCLLFAGGAATLFKYSRMSGGSMDEATARRVVTRFFGKYRGLAELRDRAVYQASLNRPVTINLPTGLRRQLTGGNLTPMRILNTAIQGTAAAGIKFAMLEALDAGLTGNPDRPDWIAAQVHDELVAVCREEEVEDYGRRLVDCMVRGMRKVLKTCPVEVELKVQKATRGWGPVDPDVLGSREETPRPR